MSPKDEENTNPSPKPGIRISDLPVSVRPSARNLLQEIDADGDGFIDESELAMALNALRASRKQNRSLTKVVGGLALSILLLVGAVFGTSIAAAHLAKDTVLDEQGVLHARGTRSLVKTGEAVTYSSDLDITGLTNDELGNLKHIVLFGGDLQFQVKGFVRHQSSTTLGDADDEKKVALLVEGGTITYGKDGMVGATGDALSFIDIASGVTGTSALDADETEDPSASDMSDETEDSSASDEARKLSSSSARPRQVSKGTERKLGRKLGATPKQKKRLKKSLAAWFKAP
mmetsp:Transcript_24361/g.57916  ORF Transcript_24361/g.57916 Transcript_24361/m.57916 type:complete len:288 (+) Transcript_24361:503-1366(+)